jgi:hypothetical protein
MLNDFLLFLFNFWTLGTEITYNSLGERLALPKMKTDFRRKKLNIKLENAGTPLNSFR